MRKQRHFDCALVLATGVTLSVLHAAAFEGHIQATITRSGPPMAVQYTVGTNWLRVEAAKTNSLEPVDLIERKTGDLTLIMPRNRCFMRIRPAVEHAANIPPSFPTPPIGTAPGMSPPMTPGSNPGLPGMAASPPPSLPANIGPTNFPTLLSSNQSMPAIPPMPAMPTMPNMPAMPTMPSTPGMPGMPSMSGNGGMPTMPMMPRGGELQLQATGEQTNLLGYACMHYEIKQWGQIMDIWATDQLLPFQVYQPHQPLRGGPPVIEEHWSELLTAKNLFPLLASLRFNNGVERYHFEVQSIHPAALTDPDAKCFQVPTNYIELQPHQF